MIDKLIGAFIDFLGQLWDDKNKKDNKKKSWKDWWEDWKIRRRKRIDDYKALPTKEKWKLELKKLGKRLLELLLVTIIATLALIILSKLDLL